MLQEARNEAGYSRSIRCIVQTPESTAMEVRTLRTVWGLMLTLIASVQMAAITSREPPKTRLSSRVGSYSQIAVAFSTAAIFVI